MLLCIIFCWLFNYISCHNIYDLLKILNLNDRDPKSSFTPSNQRCLLCLLDLYLPERSAGNKFLGVPPHPTHPPSPSGLSTMRTLFQAWLATSFPTLDWRTFEAIQCACPAKSLWAGCPIGLTQRHTVQGISGQRGQPHMDYQ